MPLQRGEVRGYEFDRMIVEFTMLNQGKVILCAISTAAMDDLEGRRDVRPDQRVDQFIRLREVIEERASVSFSKSRPRPTDLWCCDPTISLDNRYSGGLQIDRHLKFGRQLCASHCSISCTAGALHEGVAPQALRCLHPWLSKICIGVSSEGLPRSRWGLASQMRTVLLAHFGRTDGDYYDFSNTSSAHGFLSSSPTCPATQSVSASATQAWRSDERLISRNHRARWRHRKVQRCTVGYQRGLAGRRGSGTTPHGSGRRGCRPLTMAPCLIA